MLHKPGFLDAVSYRIPRKVSQALQFKDGNVFPVCPRCEITLDREFVRFCDRCGQRLLWLYYEENCIITPQR